MLKRMSESQLGGRHATVGQCGCMTWGVTYGVHPPSFVAGLGLLAFSVLINPRRACAARVTVVSWVCLSVCLCVCVSVKSHLTYGASVRPENAVTYSAGNEGQKICGVFSETAPLPRSSTPSVVRPCV